MILPRPVVFWSEGLVARPATILDAQGSASDPAHLLVRLAPGPVGELELWSVPWCDAASPVAGAWSELA